MPVISGEQEQLCSSQLALWSNSTYGSPVACSSGYRGLRIIKIQPLQVHAAHAAHAAHAGSIPVELALMMPFVLIAEAVVQIELLPPAPPFAALCALMHGDLSAARLSVHQCLLL